MFRGEGLHVGLADGWDAHQDGGDRRLSLSWNSLLIVGLAGNRTLVQLNAFNLVLTVALGSMLASVITSEDVALV